LRRWYGKAYRRLRAALRRLKDSEKKRQKFVSPITPVTVAGAALRSHYPCLESLNARRATNPADLLAKVVVQKVLGLVAVGVGRCRVQLLRGVVQLEVRAAR